VQNGLDLGIFNGQDFESVLDQRIRKRMMSEIDSINFQNSFVFDHPSQDEAWFCYPEEGETRPSKALVWNYRRNVLEFRDFVGTHAAPGAVESASTKLWSTVTGSWDDQDADRWQEGARKKIITADQASTKLRQLENTVQFNGVNFSSFVERTGLAIIGRDRQGNPKNDYESRKIIRRVWPKIRGGRVRVTLGKLEKLDPNTGQPVYSYTRTDGKNTAIFTPGSGPEYVDIINEGRLLAIKFEGVDGDHWEMDGYDIDISVLGEN
jgi:hypothetical protein